jgi:uncharacterized phiE125 gp8 family phage protein
MDLALVEPPQVEPVTLADAKMHCRIDHSDEDAYLAGLITAARRWIENVCGMALIEQTWEGALDAFPQGPISVPKYPLSSVTSVTYHPRNGVATEAEGYDVDAWKRPPRIVPHNSWPSVSLRASSGVVVRFVAGYGADEGDVPQDIRHAILLLVGQMYAHREPEVIGATVAQVGFTVDALLAPHRLW